jgi:hypothetical protein
MSDIGGQTGVFVSTAVPANVALVVQSLGPMTMLPQVLTPCLNATAENVKALSIPRWLTSGYYLNDVAFRVGGEYVASLQVLLRGRGLDSAIWWRWRLAEWEIGSWATDYTARIGETVLAGWKYAFAVTGLKVNLEYDDIAVSLRASAWQPTST